MTTEQARRILVERANHADDAGFISAMNLRTYTLRPGSPCGYGTFLLRFGEVVADKAAEWLAANKPNLRTLYMAGNCDFGFEATQALVTTLGANIAEVTPQVMEAIRDLGRVADPLPCESLGVELMTDAVLAEARAVVELAVGYDAMSVLLQNQWNARTGKLGQMQNAGVPAPATLAELDEVI